MLDVGFTVEHDCDDPMDLPKDVIIMALEERVRYLKNNPSDAAEAFGFYDTIEINHELREFRDSMMKNQ